MIYYFESEIAGTCDFVTIVLVSRVFMLIAIPTSF